MDKPKKSIYQNSLIALEIMGMALTAIFIVCLAINVFVDINKIALYTGVASTLTGCFAFFYDGYYLIMSNPATEFHKDIFVLHRWGMLITILNNIMFLNLV